MDITSNIIKSAKTYLKCLCCDNICYLHNFYIVTNRDRKFMTLPAPRLPYRK